MFLKTISVSFQELLPSVWDFPSVKPVQDSLRFQSVRRRKHKRRHVRSYTIHDKIVGNNNIPLNETTMVFSCFSVENDPHFLVSVDGLSSAVCFDVTGVPGTVYQLIHDRVTGVLSC